MKIELALENITRLFLDTAPVIYFVEENPPFLAIVNLIFDRIEAGTIIGITSSITLAECLIIPYRNKDTELQQQFLDLITNTENIVFHPIAEQVGQKAGELRAKYNLQLPDALQIATALDANCDAFLTNDIQLQRVTELQILVIRELEFS